jgi:hypothetical protein
VRRIHLIVGLLGVFVFLSTGQVMRFHVPNIHTLSAEVQLMYVSRHIYVLGAALVNLVLGLYVQEHPPGWRLSMQRIGSLLILFSTLSLILAFNAEPALGMAGRGWRSFFGLIGLFAGVMTHFVVGISRKH